MKSEHEICALNSFNAFCLTFVRMARVVFQAIHCESPTASPGAVCPTNALLSTARIDTLDVIKFFIFGFSVIFVAGFVRIPKHS